MYVIKMFEVSPILIYCNLISKNVFVIYLQKRSPLKEQALSFFFKTCFVVEVISFGGKFSGTLKNHDRLKLDNREVTSNTLQIIKSGSCGARTILNGLIPTRAEFLSSVYQEKFLENFTQVFLNSAFRKKAFEICRFYGTTRTSKARKPSFQMN